MTADSTPSANKTTTDGSRRHTVYASLRLPTGVRHSNFIRVNRPADLNGVLVIDPSMPVSMDSFHTPTSPKKKIASNGSNHLELETTHTIFADVFVLPSLPYKQVYNEKPQQEDESQRCTSISLTSSGNIRFRLHDATISTKREDRFPIVVAAAAENGRLRINLPRSFCGPLHLQCKGRVWYSPAVKAQITPREEVDDHHIVFLGDFQPSNWHGWERWQGDSFEGFAGRGDAIDIYFDDEDYIPTTGSNLNPRLPWVWAGRALGLQI